MCVSLYICFVHLFVLMAIPTTYGSSQARDWIWAVDATYAPATTMPDPLTHWARDQTQAASVEFLTPGTTAGTPEFSYVFLILNNSMLKSSFLLKIETPLFLCIVFCWYFCILFYFNPAILLWRSTATRKPELWGFDSLCLVGVFLSNIISWYIKVYLTEKVAQI